MAIYDDSDEKSTNYLYGCNPRDNNINMVNLRKHIDYLKFGINKPTELNFEQKFYN